MNQVSSPFLPPFAIWLGLVLIVMIILGAVQYAKDRKKRKQRYRW